MPTLDFDRKVEDQILRILRQRKLDCYLFHQFAPDQAKYCKKQVDDYKTAEANWFGKCKLFQLLAVAQQN